MNGCWIYAYNPSLIAQRSLNNSTKLLNQAIERMTTGFKINHASDNAANYSISTNMLTKIGAYQVAEVSSEYIRQQILQQASATLMATANQSPALALQLL